MSPVPALIVTTSKNGVLPHSMAFDPWASQQNKERLLRTINGKAIITGRKTFFALRGILPKCWIIALSRDRDYLEDGSYRDHQGYGHWFVDNLATAHNLASSLAKHNGQGEYFILGGIDIFTQTAQDIARLYLTTLPEEIEGASFTAALNLNDWQEYYSEALSASSQFQVFNKIP